MLLCGTQPIGDSWGAWAVEEAVDYELCLGLVTVCALLGEGGGSRSRDGLAELTRANAMCTYTWFGMCTSYNTISCHTRQPRAGTVTTIWHTCMANGRTQLQLAQAGSGSGPNNAQPSLILSACAH